MNIFVVVVAVVVGMRGHSTTSPISTCFSSVVLCHLVIMFHYHLLICFILFWLNVVDMLVCSIRS